MLQRNQTVSRDTAAFALSPDVPETDARVNLRRHFHALNHALPLPYPLHESWILRDHQTIQWNPQADYWLDVAESEQQRSPSRLCHQAREASWTLEEIAYYLGHITRKETPALQTTVRYTQASREQIKNKLKLLGG